MKEGAEKVELKIQAKVESLKNANEGDKGKKKIANKIKTCNSLLCLVYLLSFYKINDRWIIVRFIIG